MPEHTFLSYSRREFFFAESLVLSLQHVGLSVWFDVQQLEPGTDWKADIESGLRTSQSLTLVASRASLASPYVRAEWEAALAAGKPIYVVVFERVWLPRELRQRARLIDFRRNFERSVRELADCLSGADQRLPRIYPAILPRHSPGVARMAWAMTLWDVQNHVFMLILLLLALTLVIPGSFLRRVIEIGFLKLVNLDIGMVFDVLFVAILVVALITYLANARLHWDALRFLRRRFDYEPLVKNASVKVSYGLLVWMTAMFAGQIAVFFTDLAARARLPVGPLFRPANFLIPVAAMLIMVILGWVARRLMPTHPNADIVRWAAEFDAVSTHWRKEVNRGLINIRAPLLPPAPSAQPTVEPAAALLPVSAEGALPAFAILAGPGDEVEAAQVSDMLGGLNYIVVAPDQPATYTVLILSFRTPRALLREALRRPNLIGFLTTDIRLPKDIPQLTETQLVDIRTGGAPEARDFMRYLSTGSETYRARFSQSVLPVNLRRTGRDRVLDGYRADVIAVAGTFIGGIVYVALRLLTIHAADPGALQVAPSTAAYGALLLLISLPILGFAWGMGRGWRLLPPFALNALGVLGVALLSLLDVSVGGFLQKAVVLGTTVSLTPLTTIAVVGLAAYRVFRLIRAFGKRPALLITPGADVLGMPLLRPNFSALPAAVVQPTALAIAVLLLLTGD